jgi:hypothetical protein
MFVLIYIGLSWIFKVQGFFILYDELMGIKKIQKIVNNLRAIFFINK